MIAARRRHVTLLELIIVIAILAMVSGIVAVSVNKALVDQRFRSEVGVVVDELRLAQDLMVVLGRDVYVKFTVKKGGGGIEMWIEHETSISGNLQREVTRRRKTLETIKGVFLKDQFIDEVKQGEIDVKFFSKGAVMSKGIMRLATTDKDDPPPGTLQNYICLPGYPMPIASSETLEAAEERCQEEDREILDRLTNDTMMRLPEKVKEKPKASRDESDDGIKDKDKPVPKEDKAAPQRDKKK